MFRGKHTRSLVLTIFLFSGVLVFHHIGGGGFEFTPAFALLFLASILYFRVKPIEVFDGPDLALAILVFQGLGHFVVDSGQTQSNLKMGLSHLFASVLTYQIAKHFDRATSAYEKLIAYLFPGLPQDLALDISLNSFLLPRYFLEASADFIRRAIRERAPPAFYCA
jgi:hypothetical protein